MFAELDLDTRYIHMPGQMDYRFYLGLLRASDVHYYFSTGFVLSWSCLEAMALGCLVIASATPPVQEVIRHQYNGLLVDFNDPAALAEQTLRALREAPAMQHLRDAARRTVAHLYNSRDSVPLQQHLLADLAAGRKPPPSAQAIIEWRKRNGMAL
jgi:glycosyltransferase involved in cell wall biosynthesis